MWRLGESWCGWVAAVRAGRSWDEFGARICNHCGTWLPLGLSDETPVSIEVRAAELYACANHCAEVQDDDCHCYRPSRLLPDPHDEAEARRLYREMWATHPEES